MSKIIKIKKMRSIVKATFIAVIILFSVQLSAQKITSNNVDVTVTGTSSLHDWEMISDNGVFSAMAGKGSIENIDFHIPIKSLKSGKTAMNDNAYQALNAGKYSNITFKALSTNTLSGTNDLVGTLSINGVSKAVSIPVKVYPTNTGFILTGYTVINMTDYDVEPPMYMFGTIKTGDAVRIQFKINATY